jgi:hypothetical protein
MRRKTRGRGLSTVAAAIVAVVLAAPGDANAQSNQVGADRLVRACTPALVYSFVPGREMDATSAGSGFASNLGYTDADGNPQPTGSAFVEWTARAVVAEPDRDTGVVPVMAGSLDFALTTDSGEHLTFRATCIAAVIGTPFGFGVWANGITRGWTGAEARRTFVHFESFGNEAYVALVDGTDCRLNFDSLVVTDFPHIVGTASLTGLPANFVGAETSCSNRFGEPLPALRAPGQTAP